MDFTKFKAKFQQSNTNSPQQRTRGGGYEDEVPEFRITFEPVQSAVYTIYLFGDIVSPQQFVDALEVFKYAKQEDQVVIHLQTDGGSVAALDTFLQGMRECEADVVVRASGGVYSAGTAILLAARSFTLSDNFHAMIHNGSTGSGGKFSDYKAWSEFNVQFMDTFLRATYKDFLTAEEIEALIVGKDFWLTKEQFIARSEARNVIQKASVQASGDALMQALQNAMGNLTPEEVKQPRPRKKKVVAESQQ